MYCLQGLLPDSHGWIKMGRVGMDPPRGGNTDSPGEGTAITRHRSKWRQQIPFDRTMVGRAPSLSFSFLAHTKMQLSWWVHDRGAAPQNM